MSSLGLSETLEQEKATPERFITLIHQMIGELKAYTISQEKRKELIREDAAASIIRIVKDVAKKKTDQTSS